MRYLGLLAALFGASTGTLSANGVFACYDAVGGGSFVTRNTACATQVNFSVLPHNDIIDWGLSSNVNAGQPYGMGSNNSVLNPTSFTPIFANGAYSEWVARSTGDLITAGVTATPDGFTGSPILTRYDNSRSDMPGNFSTFAGYFPTDGDHLIGFGNAPGPLLINFGSSISSVGFYISTKSDADFDATIRIYDHVNPLTTDIPILSYKLSAQGVGGACVSEDTGGIPCLNGAFLAIDGNSSLLANAQQFRSILISTTDIHGFLIDGLEIGADSDVPEPASTVLIGAGIVLIGIRLRRNRAHS